MSKFTVSVYDLERNNFDFGLNDYPIFNEDYRPILNNAILSFYRFREIGFQNPVLWRERLRARMDLIMRNKYNELYKVKELEFNPLYNIDLTETYTHTLESDSNGQQKDVTNVVNDVTQDVNENGSNNALGLSSQFPSEEMTEDDLTSNLYIDNANKQTGNVEQKSHSTGTNIEDSTNDSRSQNKTNVIENYTRTNKGSSAGLPFSKAMIQFKEYIEKFKLDEQVIKDLSDLFITIWE